MNAGAISSRYASALLRYVQETGGGAVVSAQVRAMLRDETPESLAPELVRFTALLMEKGRMDCVRHIFLSFLRKYDDYAGIIEARLVTVVRSPGLEERLRTLLEERTGRTVMMETSVDPSIVGGFILEFDGWQMDASVARQIDLIRRDLILNNTRIV